MRLRRDNEVSYSCSCSKAELIVGLSELVKVDSLSKMTRRQLIDLAEEEDILLELEQRADVVKILTGGGIEFDSGVGTVDLVNLAIDHANARYGVADVESLGKNLKFSRFRHAIDEEEANDTKLRYRKKLQMD